jgi:hypothetical protein
MMTDPSERTKTSESKVAHHGNVEMDSKTEAGKIFNPPPSIELRETTTEKQQEERNSVIPDQASTHVVHDPGLATWRLFVIIGG